MNRAVQLVSAQIRTPRGERCPTSTWHLFRSEQIEKFGAKQPIQRAAQPEEIAPAYVFLASDADSSYVTGIVLEEMGGLTTAG